MQDIRHWQKLLGRKEELAPDAAANFQYTKAKKNDLQEKNGVNNKKKD